MKNAFIIRISVSIMLISILLISTSVFSDTIIPKGFKGIISKSDNRKIGNQFVFANLQSPKPFVTFPSGFGYGFDKVFESEDLIVLISIAYATGSIDTFYLDKGSNRFTLIEIGALEARVTGKDFIPSVTVGDLK